MKFIKRDARYGESEDGRYSICHTAGVYTAAVCGVRAWDLLGSSRYMPGDSEGRSAAYAACVAMCELNQEKGDV